MTRSRVGNLAGVWGSGDWGSVSWGELDRESALQTKPAGGFPVGLGDWRVTLEMLTEKKGVARWGEAIWGMDVWDDGMEAGLHWHDMSAFVRGVSWARGATSVGSRPEVGVMEVTLDNRGFRFSPWNAVSSWNGSVTHAQNGTIDPSYFGPGSIMRLATYSQSGQINPISDPDNRDASSKLSWVPVFAGVVSSWTDQTIAGGADSFVTVTVEESLTALAQSKFPAVAAVGDGDSPLERIGRLLDVTGWRFGPVIDRYLEPLPAVELELQATELKENRIAECYLTADSVGAVFRSDRSGLPTLYNRYGPQSPVGVRQGPDAAAIVGLASSGALSWDGELTVPYVADSVQSKNDDEIIVNTITLGNVDGETVTVSDADSIELYDPRTIQQTNLIGKSRDLLELLIDNELTTRSTLALRLETLQLHSGHVGALSALIGIDVDDLLPVELPPLIDGYRFEVPRAQVLGMAHTIEPTGSGVVWAADYTLGLQGALTARATGGWKLVDALGRKLTDRSGNYLVTKGYE